MTDVVLNHITHKQACQENTHHRIHQIKIVGFRCIEILRQEVLYPMYQQLQQQSSQSRTNADQETEQQDKTLFLNILFTPDQKALQPISFFSLHRSAHCLMIFITPPSSSLIMLDGLGDPTSSCR